MTQKQQAWLHITRSIRRSRAGFGPDKSGGLNNSQNRTLPGGIKSLGRVEQERGASPCQTSGGSWRKTKDTPGRQHKKEKKQTEWYLDPCTARHWNQEVTGPHLGENERKKRELLLQNDEGQEGGTRSAKKEKKDP